jgi:hypothetical protein
MIGRLSYWLCNQSRKNNFYFFKSYEQQIRIVHKSDTLINTGGNVKKQTASLLSKVYESRVS